MNTPTLTIEAITYNGNNSSEIMIWVQQGHKCYTDRKGRLHLQTIRGRKVVNNGDTVIKLAGNEFALINRPVVAV